MPLLFEPVTWTVVVVEVVLAVIVLTAISTRRILPLVLYPGWLRPQRRAEKKWLRARGR